ncbi:MAG: cell envelope biogenesis protein TolA, partial [Amylibacter sp.]|nr:cell envelope biogenesis protein TolA [Amylibacter sp.]
MDAGFKISGFAHLVLIGIAIFGAPLFSSDEENAIQISEVSLITLEDFASLTSVAPPVSETLINIIKPVEVEPTPVEVEPTPVEV